MLYNPYSNHYHRIDNPPTPFEMEIPNGLEPGKQIYVSGTINPDCEKFTIDLVNGNGQIAFHFNPRFSQNEIVRNSNLGGWGPEEKSGGFPFKKGRNFEVIILVEQDQYKVAINGQHSFDYRHRCPFQEISRIVLKGGIRVGQLVFSGGAHSRPNEVFSPSVPLTIPIANGLAPGRMIQIQGQVNPGASRFAINLQNGPGSYPNDIAFHFNPRYNDGSPYVVKNNRHHGGWGGEERDSHNPIPAGANFDILILCDHSEYKVAVNGQHFTSFPHRNGLHDGNHLNIEGDVTIRSIRQF